MITTKHRLTALAAALVLGVTGVTGASAATADAARTGNVWVKFGPQNCPAGGKVIGIVWAVDMVSVGPPGGDWGDRVIYPTVRIGAPSTLTYRLRCKFYGRVYDGITGQQTFTAKRVGQNFRF